MSAEMVEATLNGSFKIILPKHRADRPEWYTDEGWEKKRLARFYEVVTDQLVDRANSVVYYVGAEEGEMPALCAMWGAQVVTFEPNEKVLPNMKAIWEANKLKQPMFFAGFASNETSPDWQKHLYQNLESISGEVIGDHGFKELHDAGEIPQVRIDDMLASTDIAPPTVLTMDVEGSEFEVLKGAEQTIRQHKPVILLSLHPEFLFNYWGMYAAEVRRWVKDLGYTEELLDYQHEVHLIYMPTEG